jgi:hypothetical protein
MSRLCAAACLSLFLCGCDRATANHWQKMYLNELNLHYRTQQIKNAEIAARDKEIENQRTFMAILADRIKDLEKSHERLRDEQQVRKAKTRGPVATCSGVVTAVAGEIKIVVLSVGSDQLLIEGDQFEITREGRKIARVQLDRVDPTWSAGKVVDGETPMKGDKATLIVK